MFYIPVPTTVSLYRSSWNNVFTPIHVGAWILSIQGSENNYSIPRENGLESSEYTHMEVYISFHDGSREFNPDDFINFPKHLMEYWDGSVFQYVPIPDIQKLINFLAGV